MKEGWVIRKLGEVAEIMYGHTAKSSDDIVGVKYLRITDIQDNKVNWDTVPNCPDLNGDIEKYKLKKGDIVFARTGATTGKSFLIDYAPNAVFASYLIRVQLRFQEVLPIYLYYYFQSTMYWKLVEKGTTGSAQGGFNASKLSELVVPIPPISEQYIVVRFLDECFINIEKAKTNITKNLNSAKELFQSELSSIFSQKEEGWIEKKLGDVVEIRNGKNQQQVLTPNGKYPIYGSAANLMGYASDYICEEGTTIIGRKGNINTPLYIDHKFWNVDTAFGFHAKNGLNKKFLYYFCLGYDFGKLNRGTTIPSLVKTELLNIKISFPQNLEIQQQLVSRLDNVSAETQKIKNLYQKKLDELDVLKKSILQKAFNGELE